MPWAELPREHSLVKTPRHVVVLLLAAEGGPALAGGPFCLGVPTRPACWPLSQRSMRLVILARISWSWQTPNVLVSTTWAKTRGLLEFQLHDRTPRHSAARIALKRRPTAPEGVAYQLADCAASWRQPRCHAAASAIPPRPGASCRCDAGSLHRLPATTGVHVQGGIAGGLRFLLGGWHPPARV